MGGILPLLTLIPLILRGLSAAGALAGGAAGIAKAVQDKKSNDSANTEAERHNREVEAQLKGSGLSLGKRGGSLIPMILAGLDVASGAKPFKAFKAKKANDSANAEAERQKGGSGLFLGRGVHGGCCPKCKGSGLFLSKKISPLSNFDIENAAKSIPNFRGVFMRDGLPSKIRQKECGVVNLDSRSGSGTHWVAYWKDGPKAVYFDSYGVDPPIEVADYLNCDLRTQTFQLQGPNEVICGHLCLHVIRQLSAGKRFEDIILSIV